VLFLLPGLVFAVALLSLSPGQRLRGALLCCADVFFVNFKYAAFPRINERFFWLLGKPQGLEDDFAVVFRATSYSCDLLLGAVPQLLVLAYNDYQLAQAGDGVAGLGAVDIADLVGVAASVALGLLWLGANTMNQKSLFRAATGRQRDALRGQDSKVVDDVGVESEDLAVSVRA